MILTGKALEDFKKSQLGNKSELFNIMMPIYQHALIIEFFDSLGIYVNIMLSENAKSKFRYLVTDGNTRHLHDFNDSSEYNSRQEATKTAIIKANEIYNNK